MLNMLGFGEALILFATLALFVLIPALAIALGLRLAGVGRNDPERRLRRRLSRGEITQADFEVAIRALGR